MANWIYLLVYLGFQLAALLCVRAAITNGRTPQGAVGWVVFLFAAPYIAVPIFLIFGHRRYPGYISTRRALRAEIAALRDMAARHAPPPDPDDPGDAGRLKAFERLAGVPFANGNALRLLINGDTAFPEIFAALDRAERYILVQFYTINDDALGRDLADRLIARARAGVRVHVLYDAIGSRLGRAYLARLREAGVQIRDFHAIRRSRGRLQVNFRNHRKIVVVDGTMAFTGGLNLGDEYIGRRPALSPWRDTMVRVQGPSVAQLQFVFAEDWLWSSGDKLALDWSPGPTPGTATALVLPPGPADPQESGSLYFVNAIGAAQERIWIASAYFVPDTDVLSALKVAVLRGVDVRILIPDRRDHWLVWLAAYGFVDEVRRAGVGVWRYTEGFMHQKVLLIDDDIASVGSINLDNRSCRLNFEVTLIAADRPFAAEVAQMLEQDFTRAEPVRATLSHRREKAVLLAAPLARLLAPIL